MSTEQNQIALLPQPTELNPIQLLQIAVAKGVDTEQLKQLMELQREWKAERARDAFHAAMNAFRSEAIEIVKTKRVSFGGTSYNHATLAGIVEASVPALSKHGLSHRWETKQDGSGITVACVVTHELGHSAQTSLTALPDTSGSKNSIQAIGSTVSYLQRYTLMAITGLAAKDQDDDARAAGVPLITEQQAADLGALCDEIGTDTASKLCRHLGIDSLAQVKASEYEAVVKKVQAKRRG